MLKCFSKWHTRELTISETAGLLGDAFNSDKVELIFLDSVLEHFSAFDKFNLRRGNIYTDDLDYIIQCTITDLTSREHTSRSKKRIDAYLYIYRRIQEYSSLVTGYCNQLKELDHYLFHFLVSTFDETEGEQPNLLVENKDTLLRMNIRQHLSFVTIINDSETLKKFFVLSKLSLQASQLINDNLHRVRWIDILANVRDTKINLDKFIEVYLTYPKAFLAFPFKIPELLYLIQRMHPSRRTIESPFKLFVRLIDQLKLNRTQFFEQFLAIFSNGIKNRWYEMKDITELLTWIRNADKLFGPYFLEYSDNVDINELWNMSLYLYKSGAVNDVTQKYLIPTLNKRTLLISVEIFRGYTKLAMNVFKEIQPKLRSYFIDLFQTIFDNYISNQMRNPQYSFQFPRTDYAELLRVGLKISSKKLPERTSCLFLVRKIFFEIDSNRIINAQRLKILFENLKKSDEYISQEYTPESIITDECLKDFLISYIQIWLKLDQNTYNHLCENHKNHPWIIYAWSRIMHLSIPRMLNHNHKVEILWGINDWMEKVKHDVYNEKDILTIIIVNELYKLILMTYSRAILTLPNVHTIVNFIISMRDSKSVRIDIDSIDNFISNGKEILCEILQLRSKFITLPRRLFSSYIIGLFIFSVICLFVINNRFILSIMAMSFLQLFYQQLVYLTIS